MARIQLFALLLGALLSLAAASSTPTFCKCTCFKNSTIIPLTEDAGTSRRGLIPSTHPDHLLSGDRDRLVFDVAQNDRHTTRDRHTTGEDDTHVTSEDDRHTTRDRHTTSEGNTHVTSEDDRHASRDRHTTSSGDTHITSEDDRHTTRDRHTTSEDNTHATSEDDRHTTRDRHTTGEDKPDNTHVTRSRIQKRVPAACSACTKTFCRSHGLPICADATDDDDVTTMCFQRDSPTDRLIVWGFILGVLGLLGWAAVRKVRAAREAQRGFVGGSGGGGYSPLGQGRG